MACNISCLVSKTRKSYKCECTCIICRLNFTQRGRQQQSVCVCAALYSRPQLWPFSAAFPGSAIATTATGCVHSIITQWVMTSSVRLQDAGDTNRHSVCLSAPLCASGFSFLLSISCLDFIVTHFHIADVTAAHGFLLLSPLIVSPSLSFPKTLHTDKWCPFIHHRFKLSVFVVSFSLSLPFVFLCSVSSGFIVVLPRKPGKVTSAAASGRVKAASPFSTEGVHRFLFPYTWRKYRYDTVNLYLFNFTFSRKKHSFVALQRVSGFRRPLVFLLWFVWCWEWQIAQCEAGDSDMAEGVISGSVIYSVLGTEAGKQIKLLGERSRKFLLCWYRLEVCFAGRFEKQ